MFVRESEVSAQSRQQIVAYWLMPAEPARTYFVSLIADLAARFDASVFEPHLTIYVTTAGSEKADEVIQRVFADCGPYRLVISGTAYSDEFTKTVFVEFQPNEELIRLSGNFRRASAGQDEYQLNPHLSLIYKTMSRATKEEIATSLRFPFDEVLFDSAKAVISPADIKSREDVESWRVLAVQSLNE